MGAADHYDEFSLFPENAAEAGLPWDGPPTVARVDTDVDDRNVSALVWGREPAELVLVHGGGQNAHTWDTVALALRRPLVAIDLPGHGRSAWREDHDYSPGTNAATIAPLIEKLAPSARVVCGMSLGGMTVTALAARRPDLVRRLVVVDVTPGVTGGKAAAITTFLRSRDRFESFDDILSYTMEHNPTRSESSLRRGVMHNARPLEDGSWVWRHDLAGHAGEPDADTARMAERFAVLWEDVSAVKAPFLLVQGALSPVVDDDDIAELKRRQPDARVEVVDGAGHSIQGDRPVELAAILEAELRRQPTTNCQE